MLTTYWILETILALTAVAAGLAIARSADGPHRNRVLAVASTVMVAAFMVIKGLRMGRGEDYSVYLGYYTGMTQAHLPHEAIFQLTIRAFRALGAPFWAVTMYLSGFFMASVMTLTARFRRYAAWALPAMVLLAGGASENLIRQFYALSFVFFSSALWLHAEASRFRSLWLNIASWLTLAMAPFVHLTGILPAMGLVSIRLMTLRGHGHPGRHPWVLWGLVGLYAALLGVRCSGLLLGLPDWASGIASSLRLDASSHWQRYLIDAGEWLRPDHTPFDGSPLSIAVQWIWPPVLIIFGYRALAHDHRLSVPYWMSVYAIMLLAVGGDLMVVRRMAWWGSVYIPFVAGSVLTHCLGVATQGWRPLRDRIREGLPFWLATGCYVLTYVTPFIFRWGMEPHAGHLFIWDL